MREPSRLIVLPLEEEVADITNPYIDLYMAKAGCALQTLVQLGEKLPTLATHARELTSKMSAALPSCDTGERIASSYGLLGAYASLVSVQYRSCL